MFLIKALNQINHLLIFLYLPVTVFHVMRTYPNCFLFLLGNEYFISDCSILIIQQHICFDFAGYNACVFAYGQTGSGKTFTMMGSSDNPGLIPRICHELFARMKVGLESGTGYKTHASYLEIYNERVKDLLGPAAVGHGLRVREHRSLGPYVENLSQHAVNDYEEILVRNCGQCRQC